MQTDKTNLIGRRLRFFRERAGYSQFKLETEIGMSSGALSKIENGAVNPTKETLLSIAQVLQMNLKEQAYTFGFRMYPVSQESIAKAKESIYKHYQNPLVFSYFVDDRYRFWGVSKSMQRLLRLSNEEVQARLGKSLIEIALDSDFMNKFIDTSTYVQTIKNILEIFYAESGFMVDDEIISNTISMIVSHPVASDIWKEVLASSKINLHLVKQRGVTFKIGPVSIPINYSDIPLISDERFTVIEYTVGIKEMKLLKL